MTSISKSLVLYAVGLVVVWVLLPIAWSGARAAVGALETAEDTQLRQQVGELLERNGIPENEIPETLYRRVEMAKEIPAAQQELEALTQGRMVSRMNWFVLALVVSVVVFGVVSYVCCYIAMDVALVGAIPVAHFLIRNPLFGFSFRDKLTSTAQSYIVLAAQLGACYLFGYIASSIATRRNVQRWRRRR